MASILIETTNEFSGEEVMSATRTNAPIRIESSSPVLTPEMISIFRIGRYLIVRLATVFLTLVVGVYIGIVIANLGGYVDEIVRDRINHAIMGAAMGGWLSEIKDVEQRDQMIEDQRIEMERAAGLYDPFLLRCVRWLYQNMTFQWNDPRISEALPNTLLLFSIASLLLFFSSLLLALYLSRNYGSLLDRLVVSLSPISSIPSWALGLLLVMLFTVQLHWLPASTNIMPFNQIIQGLVQDFNSQHILLMAKYLILPVSAVFLSMFFQLTYSWRTFFLIYSHEDYVELAKAKGLASQLVERQYILRPSLPYIITNFSLVMISYWQTSMALEAFFHWPGIGSLYVDSVRHTTYQANLVMTIVTIFAYLLALTVLVLDVIYAFIDPRVRLLGGSQSTARLPIRERWSRFVKRLRNPPPKYKRISEASPKQQTSNPLEKEVNLQPTRQARGQRRFRTTLAEIARYPSALIGSAFILILLIISVTVPILLPYKEVVSLWVSDSWFRSPENAVPVWFNYFREEKLPLTINLSSKDGEAVKSMKPIDDTMSDVKIVFTIEYPYKLPPQDMVLFFYATYQVKRPFVSLSWITPDGRQIGLGTVTTTSETRIYASQEKGWERKLGLPAQKGLFNKPDSQDGASLPGTYQLVVEGVTFEQEAELDAEVLLYGEAHGIAGTDHRRRDLFLALLWGTPVALALGLFGAVLTSLASLLFAAIGAWFGGWVDSLIQSITEVNIILPILPIGVMAFFLYGKNVWIVIGMIILFSIFSSSTKNYRAAFLQVKESPYIEAAQAYGCSGWRMIFRYVIPRILPAVVPQLVATVPGFIFLEATLAVVRVSDPYIPTWGSIIYDALVHGTFGKHYYWVLEPIVLLVITGMAFALLGFALDRVFNPRLRDL